MAGLRFLVVAEEGTGLRALRAVERSAHEMVAVVTSSGGGAATASVHRHGEAKGLTVFPAESVRAEAFADKLVAMDIDVLLNVHSLHKIHPAVRRACPVGAWNLHPGPLPELAGLNSPSWAIALGHRSHGVTVHEIAAEIDAGAISYETRFAIPEQSTGLSLSIRCATEGLLLIDRLLDDLACNTPSVPSREQDASQRQYRGRGQPDDATIDWSSPSGEIESHVRAADFRPFDSPWQSPVADVGGEATRLIEVEVAEPVTGTAPGTVRTDGWSRAVAAIDRWVRLVAEQRIDRAVNNRAVDNRAVDNRAER